MARIFVAVALVLVALALLCTRLGGLDDHHRARRVLLWNGVVCEPKIVEREEDGLQVVCADGTHELRRQPMCDESWGCLLGVDVACWDYAPGR